MMGVAIIRPKRPRPWVEFCNSDGQMRAYAQAGFGIDLSVHGYNNGEVIYLSKPDWDAFVEKVNELYAETA